MMNHVTGIVAEFNPFHNGHKYLLEQASGLKVIAMSGNFVQRGEPAFVDKWTRTQMALTCGADIVVELPFLVSVQAADYFAKGAIDILAKLGVTQLCFGSEELRDYNALGDVYQSQKAEMTAFIKGLPDSLSYPQKTQMMWQHFTNIPFSGETPNHILALAYAKVARGYGISLSPIKRQGAGFHSTEKDVAYASATSLRHHAADKAFLRRFMPNAELLEEAILVDWSLYFPLLRYQIMTHQDLTEIYQVNSELSNRLKLAIKSSHTVEELVAKTATKRYTKARIRRILTYILVNATERPLPKAIHVLGFSAKGQSHLKTLRDKVELVTRIGKTPWDSLTQKADKVYQLGDEAIREQNYGQIVRRCP
ncbi:nucleotidyltransferase [Streptococcus sp. zg-JUN1979]|uniref:nucleotidyltransferase n=1 Tax=Streptococcus sp. zg-JUN1979 TaxID=3391450 RepID=UPI0039A49B3B